MMHLTQHLTIDNSIESAVKTGSWRNPPAKFYRKLMNKVEWKELLAEAYLIAPVETIQNEEEGITPFTQCGCRLAHHVICNDRLILSVPGLKAAYAKAKGEGICHGALQRHLERHIEELKGLPDLDITITSNLEDVCAFIQEQSKTEIEYICVPSSTKEESFQELYCRRENNEAYLRAAKNRIQYTSEEAESLLRILHHRGEMIQTDIDSIINGRYTTSMMEKYHSLPSPVDAFLFEAPEEIVDQTTVDTISDKESNPASQVYCYRVGFDLATGKQVAVQFTLDSRQAAVSCETKLRYRAIPEAADLIEKYGDVDFRTDALHVSAIFERNGKALDNVKMIGLFSVPVTKAIRDFLSSHPELKENPTTSGGLFDMELFQNHLSECFKKFCWFSKDYETYTVGDVCGYGTYKTTKLLWDRELLLSYKLTPILRGYNNPIKEMDEDSTSWFCSMIEGLKISSVEGDLALMENIVREESDFWMAMGILLEQRFTMESLPGCPAISNTEEYQPNPSLEKIYFETMMLENWTVINEYYPIGEPNDYT